MFCCCSGSLWGFANNGNAGDSGYGVHDKIEWDLLGRTMEGMVWCLEKNILLKESAAGYCLRRQLFKDSPDGAGYCIGIYLLQTDSPDGAYHRI